MALGGVVATQFAVPSARAYALWLAGLDVIEEPAAVKRYGVDIGTVALTVTAAGGVSTMSFAIDDPLKLITVTDGQAVVLHDLANDQRLFAGWVDHYSVRPDFGGQGRTIVVAAVGPESLLDWYVTSRGLNFLNVPLTDMIQGIVSVAYGIGELRAFVDDVNDQGSQEKPIGNLGGAAPAGIETQRVDVEGGTAPWVAGVIAGYVNAATLSAVGADAPPGGGAASVAVVCSGAAPDQMAYVPLTGTFLSGNAYSVTFWIKQTTGFTGAPMQWIFGSNGTSTDRSASGGQALSGSWTRHTMSWTPTANRADAVLAIASYGVAPITARVDLITVVAGGIVAIPAGTPVRSAILQAAAACVDPTFLGLNLTVDHLFGLRAWQVLAMPTPPSDVAAAIGVDPASTTRATDLGYDVDASGIVRAVMVIGAGSITVTVGDGSGRPGRMAVLTDTSITTVEVATARGQAYINDYRAGLRGHLGLEDAAAGPTAAIDALRILALTDPATGGSGTYGIASLEFAFWGAKRDAIVNYGGLPPSGAALIRKLTRSTLS